MPAGPRPDSDVIVIGAGAAGLFFAAEAGRRGRRVLVVDHAKRIGEKIRISGGGRCNFTNLGTGPEHFLSQNPKFAVSALRRFTPRDFLDRVEAAGIAWHEKALGQLFCDGSAQEIIDMLLAGCSSVGAEIRSGTPVDGVECDGGMFVLRCGGETLTAPTLVVATGGKSIPKIGATGFGYQVAEQFGLGVIDPRPALVPLTFDGAVREMAKELAGVSVEASVTADPAAGGSTGKKRRATAFRDGFLFTHRGLSGPSVLQVSSYWRESSAVVVDFAPGRDVFAMLRERRAAQGRVAIHTALADVLPKRLASALARDEAWQGQLADFSDRRLRDVAERIHHWRVTPTGSEGYRTAEVTLGGVDTEHLDSRTMGAKGVPGLIFIGEVVDVTGWLGGYNFQWAWSSAHAAAQFV